MAVKMLLSLICLFNGHSYLAIFYHFDHAHTDTWPRGLTLSARAWVRVAIVRGSNPHLLFFLTIFFQLILGSFCTLVLSICTL